MKTTFLILLLACLLQSSRGQNCDIAQMGMTIYDGANTSPVASVAAGQQANFKFSIANLGTDIHCSIPAFSVKAVFSFPNGAGSARVYTYDGPVSFSSGYFTWTYNSTDDVLTGTNMTAIPNGTGDLDVLVKVKGDAAGTASSTLTLLQKSGISDHTGNDVSSARLKVTAAPVPPVKLASFSAVPDKCNAVLNWTTASEGADFSHFDVEYSADGTTFIKVGTVKGKNEAAGTGYSFTYFQLNGNGYYRLKQTARDGKFEYSDVVRTTTACTEKGKIMVYPNPLNYDQKLLVNISGYTGKINGELFNTAGQKTGSYNLVNGRNEIEVASLNSGTYTLYIRNNGKEDLFKIMVLR